MVQPSKPNGNNSRKKISVMIRKHFILMAAAVATCFTLTSCGPHSQEGAVIGGLLGAGAGAIIGSQSGRGLEGAAIGGALGAGSGALLGDAKDQRHGHNRYDQGRRYDYDRRDRGYHYDRGRRYDDRHHHHHDHYDSRSRGRGYYDDRYYPY